MLSFTFVLYDMYTWYVHTQVTVSQMRLAIFLCLVVASPTPPGFTETYAVELKPWLASFTLPIGPVVQEKVS